MEKQFIENILYKNANDPKRSVYIEFSLFNDNEKFVMATHDRIKKHYGLENVRDVEYSNEIITTNTGKYIQETFNVDSKSYAIGNIFDRPNYGFKVILSSTKAKEGSIGSNIVQASIIELPSIRIVITPTKVILKINSSDLEKKIYQIVEFYKLLHDTNEIYTLQDVQGTFSTVNRLLGYRENNYLPSKALYHPRDMKMEDLVGDVFLGKTTIMFKVDGLRKMLYINGTKIWLLYGANANLVTSNAKQSGIYVLDGEFITIKDKYTYLYFDTLIANGVDIRSQSYLERRVAGIKDYKDEKITIELLPNYSYNTAEEFYDTMKYLEDKQKPKLKYKEDGYIFVSNDLKYNSGIDSCPLKDRVLTERFDWIKWKPVEKLTVDLKVENDGQYHLYSKSGYVATINIPSNFSGLTTGSVVEFKQQNGEFVPLKLRPDKLDGNTKDEVDNLLALSRNPIKLSTLMGKDLTLMNEFHLRVVNNKLINYKGTLILLGVNLGFDLRRFKKVYMVDQHKEPILDSDSKFTMVDSIDSIDDKVDVILCHGELLSAEDIQRLIKPVLGVVIYLTLDGVALKNAFHPLVRNKVPPPDGKIIADSYTMEEHDNGVLLNGTLYPYQYPDNIAKQLQCEHVFTRMGYEGMLSHQEKYLSSLYSMGVISNVTMKTIKPKSVQIDLPELEEVPERVVNVITLADINIKFTVPIYVGESKSNVVVSEESFYRISANEGNFYDALLLSFYKEYILGDSYHRRILALALENKYPNQDVLLLAAELFINIIVLDITNPNERVLIYDANITALTAKQKQRPSVILGRIDYQGEYYYEVIATMVDKFYKTIFERSDNIVQSFIGLDSVLSDERYILPKANRKYKIATGKSSSVLEMNTTIYDSLQVDHDKTPQSILRELLDNEDVLDLTKDSSEYTHDVVIWYGDDIDSFKESISNALSNLNDGGSLGFQIPNLNNNNVQMVNYIFTDIFETVQVVTMDNYLFLLAFNLMDRDTAEKLESVLPDDLMVSGIDKDTRFLSHARSLLRHIMKTTIDKYYISD